MIRFEGQERLGKKWLVAGIGLTFAARLGTQIYYLSYMPRAPQPLYGRYASVFVKFQLDLPDAGSVEFLL
jgi:hypothetical protein